MKFSDHVCGGYFLVRRATPQIQAKTLPNVSISYDFVDFMPDSWLLNWPGVRVKRSRQIAAEAGVNMEKFIEAMTWTTDHFNTHVGWPHVFFTLSDAQWFRAEFLADPASYALLGIGMPKPLLTLSLDDIISRHGENEGWPGLYRMLQQNQPLATPHIVLGYDILTFAEGAVFISWLLKVLMRNDPFIHRYLSRHRFIRHYRDAFKVSKQAITEGYTGEPIVQLYGWMPWLIVRYPDHPTP